MKFAKTALALFVTLTVSSCSWGKAIKDWSVDMGKYLPVKEEERRCINSMFCGKEGYPKQDRPGVAKSNIQTPPPAPRSATPGYGSYGTPPPAPTNIPPGFRTPDEAYGESPEEEYSSDEQMKPWEENPEWKRDLEPSPIDQIKQGIDW